MKNRKYFIIIMSILFYNISLISVGRYEGLHLLTTSSSFPFGSALSRHCGDIFSQNDKMWLPVNGVKECRYINLILARANDFYKQKEEIEQLKSSVYEAHKIRNSRMEKAAQNNLDEKLQNFPHHEKYCFKDTLTSSELNKLSVAMDKLFQDYLAAYPTNKYIEYQVENDSKNIAAILGGYHK